MGVVGCIGISITNLLSCLEGVENKTIRPSSIYLVLNS
nr:MAG TPA: hypothetical protein [Caudoviricetes sp.]